MSRSLAARTSLFGVPPACRYSTLTSYRHPAFRVIATGGVGLQVDAADALHLLARSARPR